MSTSPEQPTKKPKKNSSELAVKLIEYRNMLEEARALGEDSIEVSQEVFDFITAGQKTPFLTEGNPGVMVFVEGTKEKHLADGRLNAEVHYDRVIKKSL